MPLQQVQRAAISLHALLGAMILFVVGLAPIILPTHEAMPLSLLTAVPALSGARLIGDAGLWVGGAVGAMISPAFFLLVVTRVDEWPDPLPRASLIALAAISLVSTLIITAMFGAIVERVSLLRAAAVTAQAVVPPVLLGLILTIRKCHATITQSVWLHWCALLWLSWSAFPWYFEFL